MQLEGQSMFRKRQHHTGLRSVAESVIAAAIVPFLTYQERANFSSTAKVYHNIDMKLKELQSLQKLEDLIANESKKTYYMGSICARSERLYSTLAKLGNYFLYLGSIGSFFWFSIADRNNEYMVISGLSTVALTAMYYLTGYYDNNIRFITKEKVPVAKNSVEEKLIFEHLSKFNPSENEQLSLSETTRGNLLSFICGAKKEIKRSLDPVSDKDNKSANRRILF